MNGDVITWAQAGIGTTILAAVLVAMKWISSRLSSKQDKADCTKAMQKGEDAMGVIKADVKALYRTSDRTEVMVEILLNDRGITPPKKSVQ